MDPTCTTETPTLGPLHAVRGGSWLISAGELAASVRIGVRPSNQRPDIGFRCVRHVAQL